MPEPPKRRHLALAVGLGLVVMATAGWAWLEDRDAEDRLDPVVIGESKPANSAADCGPVLREPAGNAGDHIDDAPIVYSSAPPSFGDHRSRWEVRALSFYDVHDRPDASVLVHNLEHGYNILWYDQAVVDDADALAQVREIAEGYATVDRTPDPSTAFIAAPWTADDGDAFPAGKHYALTHWYADPTDRTRSRADEAGLTRFCARITPGIVQAWMADYPLSDAPEGYPDLM